MNLVRSINKAEQDLLGVKKMSTFIVYYGTL